MAESVESGHAKQLRRIEAVTDSALAHLDVPDLLDELLVRVRELLSADTAAVLLLDQSTRELVATAASGIEEEVRQGVRIPLGAGFAGRIAAEGVPVIIEDVDHAVVRNPLLRQRGIKSMLGVPLIVESRVTGVMHVGSLVRRDFDQQDIDLLQLVADRVALAVDARRANVERAAAATVQRSLVPGRPPGVTGLELASRYLPGEAGGVGGDWYDVFSLPSGHVGVVIGDVVGRGLGAAIVMGRLRSALRAYALEDSDPAEVLTRLDRKLQHFEAGQLTTVLYAVLDPALDSVTISSAGHPWPVVSSPGEGSRWLTGTVDPPLGVSGTSRRGSITTTLIPGSMLAFFTDGLVERPGMLLDDEVARLEKCFIDGSAESTCEQIVATLVGGHVLRDDVALLVLRRQELDAPLEFDAPAVPASLRQLRRSISRWLGWQDATEDDCFRIMLAVGEAASNAIEHAYGMAGGRISVRVSRSGADIEATVRDSGSWRAPRGSHRGRGISIINKTADHVAVDRQSDGTTIQLRFTGAGPCST